METVKYVAAFILILTGLISAGIAVLGNFRLKFCVNRIHSAGLIDTFSLGFFLVGLMLLSGFTFTTLKLLLVLVLLWCASPVSSHLLSRFEFTVDEKKVSEEIVSSDSPVSEDSETEDV